MALETASFIDGLNSSNPAATDALAQADDHLRLIKAAIKATFPNITGAVTLTQAQINALADTVPAPAGTKMLFRQSTAPNGWTKETADDNAAIRVVSGSVTDGGTNGFTNSFNTAFTISGTTGGSGTLYTSSGTSGSTTLSISQIPAHSHDITESFTKEDNNFTAGSERPLRENSVNLGNYTVTTTSTGGGGGHDHTIPALDIPSHTHTFSDDHNFDVKYVDVIVCTKD